MRIELKSLLLTLATLPAILSEGATSKVLQHRLYEQPGCGISEVLEPGSWKSPGQNNIGIIELSFDGITDESMKECFREAARYWGATIQNRIPIHIQAATLSDLEDELVLCDVIFFEETKTTMAPSALHVQDTGIENVDSPDAFIWLNPAKQWDTSIGVTTSSTANSLYTCALRSIAVCLGFGSSVTSFDGINPCFQWDGHLSKFDQLIIDSSGKKLSDCMGDDNALRAFVSPSSGKSIYAGKKTTEYKMYSPSDFRQRESLVYLDNPMSLMHYGLGSGDRNFKIDNTTASLMNQIGWDIPMSIDGQIVCSNIDDMGYGKALASHTFKLKTDTQSPIDKYHWEFRLFSEIDGSPITYTTSSSSEFNINNIPDANGYQLLPGGELRAEVRLTVTLDNQQYEVAPLALKLTQEPHFSFLRLIRTQPSEDGNTDLMFGVNCLGTSEFSANVMEWANPYYRVFDFDTKGQFHIHATIPNVDLSETVEIEFIATNSFGTTVRNYTLRPNMIALLKDYPFCTLDLKFEKFDNADEYVEVNYILVYDSNSNLITKGYSYNEIIKALSPGTYFFHYYKNGELKEMQYVVIH